MSVKDLLLRHWKVILFAILMMIFLSVGIWLIASWPRYNNTPPNICPKDCTNRGQCIQGLCTCYIGFAGTDCGIQCPGKVDPCPDKTPCYCSGHGTCSITDGKCFCKNGWSGDDCNTKS
jgi:hypothetical protein